MIALTNILVATDFSDTSRAALKRARGLAAAFQARLHILHVVTEPLHEIWACYAPGADFLQSVAKLQEHSRARMLGDISLREMASGRMILATSWGDPSDEILKYAREHDIDMIVCGTHGRRGWDHALVGSVAERIVRLAPCPVLTVHDGPGLSAAAA
jgi:nucleotide-binding universal stress UspA family protein